MASRCNLSHISYSSTRAIYSRKNPIIMNTSISNPFPTFFCWMNKRYSQVKNGHDEDHMPEDRAASTAQEFRKMAEDKARQGIASQTVEKAFDGVQQAALNDSDLESVKESFKEPPGVGDFHKTGDEIIPEPPSTLKPAETTSG